MKTSKSINLQIMHYGKSVFQGTVLLLLCITSAPVIIIIIYVTSNTNCWCFTTSVYFSWKLRFWRCRGMIF